MANTQDKEVNQLIVILFLHKHLIFNNLPYLTKQECFFATIKSAHNPWGYLSFTLWGRLK
jgi:hypothetical protein